MEKRVKIFNQPNIFDLEDAINKFLIYTDGKLHSIEFQLKGDDDLGGCACALLIYTPEDFGDAIEERKK